MAFPGWVFIVGYVLMVAGMIVIGVTFKSYDTSEFLGIKIMNEFNPSATPLITTGLNAFVRHPIYFGILVTLIGYLLISFDYKTLTFFIIAFIYIVVGAKLEERKLLRIYGNQYIEYKKRVKMLTPFI
jgi:protein-S-isoprenylcysteine O-methyltransferase Ste14